MYSTPDRNIILGDHVILVAHGGGDGAKCLDGALTRKIKLKALGLEGEDARRVSQFDYDHRRPEVMEAQVRADMRPGTAIWFLDMTPRPAFLKELSDSGMLVAAYGRDHHATGEDMAHGFGLKADRHDPGRFRSRGSRRRPALDFIIHSGRASAAGMLWDMDMPNTPPPPLVLLADKMDRGGEGLVTDGQRDAAAYVDSFDISTPARANLSLDTLLHEFFPSMSLKGKLMRQKELQKIHDLLDSAIFVQLPLLPGAAPSRVALVKGDVHDYIRDVSPMLVNFAHDRGAVAGFVWDCDKNGEVTLSIRTNGTPSSKAVAEHLKALSGVTDERGGGHPGSACAYLPMEKFARHVLSNAESVPAPHYSFIRASNEDVEMPRIPPAARVPRFT